MRRAAGRPGQVIALTRQAHGLTQRQLGELAGYTQSTISRLEDGADNAYDIRVLRHFATLLRIPPRLLGLADGPDTVGPHELERDVKRREFLELPAVLAGTRLESWDLDPVQDRISAAQVRMVRDQVAALHTLDFQFGGDRLHETAGLLLARVQRWLNDCTYGPAMERQLYAVMAEVAAAAGWFAYDAGLQAEARRYYNEGLRAAVLAEDRALQARVCQHMAQQARFLGRPREALGLAKRALRLTEGRARKRLIALVAVREALAWAKLGDTSASRRALDRARETLDEAKRDRPPAWLAYMNVAEVAGMAAVAEIDLGNFPRAAELTREALDAYGNDYPRNTLFYTVQLAECYQRMGDLDEACRVGHDALVRLPEVTSTRSRTKLRAFRDTITRAAPRERAVREFVDHCAVVGI
ncbi:hypothetical protein TH66_12875 [Carbonactinospora thermoautotrophica]|uniref:Putative regulatory protein n=1 Tax=Carbonactinospora thermoautotrophica TaxID=1469144 RepID=A0A132MXR0_9ACTN|nr:helix-turn-helix transcriptional regulator [Carbonactinospora thermoautotrophica]KWX02639.1 putative regulatory protein [Carbonactinospora thermoautotrophica]KWX03693.1 hypothetical protein TH66_12875 [Carbonactinospora thermoautotrophica]KWX06404.1 hypothetical protein TR74_22155 [Carbonactinospora thermoautotrophica]